MGESVAGAGFDALARQGEEVVRPGTPASGWRPAMGGRRPRQFGSRTSGGRRRCVPSPENDVDPSPVWLLLVVTTVVNVDAHAAALSGPNPLPLSGPNPLPLSRGPTHDSSRVL